MSETAPQASQPEMGRNKFLGVHFRCCNIYRRVYRNRNGTGYEGRCPRCGKQVHIPIGEGGVSNRFFEAF